MNTTAKEARENSIYVIETSNEKYDPYYIGTRQMGSKLVSFDLKVVETNLFDWVMLSAEETTSPRGVETKMHIEPKEQDCSCLDSDGDADKNCPKCNGYGTQTVYQLRHWGPSGHGDSVIDTFDTEEEAENEAFRRTYEYDFLADDQRDTSYYSTREEAEIALTEQLNNR